MSSRRGTILTISAAGAISILSGIITGTWRTATYAAELQTLAKKVTALETAVTQHLSDVDRAMKPGGYMYEARSLDQQRQDKRDKWIVESVSGLCIAHPQAHCPSPADLITPSR